jgi:hypothetical protein
MQRIGIGVGLNCDSPDAHPLGGFDDAASNLAAIGNEEGGEHQASRICVAFRAFMASMSLIVASPSSGSDV